MLNDTCPDSMLIELYGNLKFINIEKAMGKTEHCRTEATMNFQNGDTDHIQRSGKLSSSAKTINVPSFRVGEAFGLFTPYLNDVFLAAHILRGKHEIWDGEFRCVRNSG